MATMKVSELAPALAGLGHPVRLQCLVLLEVEHSPSELAAMLKQFEGPTLGTVAYHMRMLRDYQLIEEVRTEPRRGAIEHFYIRTPLAEELVRMLAPVLGLPRKTRRRGEAREHELLRALGVETEALAA
jgi:DNA-binding PadR family transcriptional regulator